jgi:2-keto-4-pentenoate hydratase/2-oxohepta-3-ene-1,7-dioic acid hydratase in catechol pathway
MKLCMFTPRELALERGWPGRVDGDRVIQLAAQTLQAFFTGGGGAREHAQYALTDVDLRPPVLSPPNVRIFNGLTLDFAFGNTASIYGPGAEIPFPEGARELDFGLGVAAVIGAEGAVGGFTLANTWRAAELPGEKRRDFALSIGPVVATGLDGWDVRGRAAGGREAEGTAAGLNWDAVVEHASRNTQLRPGDLLVVDLGPGRAGLRPGDVVELEHDELGVLRSRVSG